MNYVAHLQMFALALIIFAPLEMLLPRRTGLTPMRRLWKTDVLYVLVGYVITSVISVFFLFGGIILLGPLAPEAMENAIASQPIWIQFIEIVILADLAYYAAHFAAHKIPLLWRFHSVHHSIEDMDWLAASRVHPFDQMMTGGMTLMIPIVMGFSFEAIALHALQFSWHSLLKHSNVRVGWGPLRWILCTPTYHHWHHANEPQAWDKNFAGQLPIIDLIFGTAHMTEKQSPTVYGVDDPVPDGFVDQLFYPFKRADQRDAKTGDADLPAQSLVS